MLYEKRVTFWLTVNEMAVYVNPYKIEYDMIYGNELCSCSGMSISLAFGSHGVFKWMVCITVGPTLVIHIVYNTCIMKHDVA